MFWTTRFWSGLYFGGFVAGAALIPHSLLFAGWLAVRRNYDGIDSTLSRRVVMCAGLALPFSLVIFDSQYDQIGERWSGAFAVFPWVFLSTWVAILIPVALMRFLQWVPDEAA
jgi:hypothetical protein